MTDGFTEGLVAFDMFIQDKAYHVKYLIFFNSIERDLLIAT